MADTRANVGNGAEVSWSDDEGLRMLPAELVAVQPNSVPLWHFRALRPAGRVQRRQAVRLPLSLPVQVEHQGRILVGSTSDLSEGGLNCTVTADGPSFPGAGDAVDHNPLRTAASVIRVRQHDLQQSSLVLAFQGLSERHQDQIRTRVFIEQRNLRASDLD